MDNKELIKMWRASKEPNFLVWLENNIEFEENINEINLPVRDGQGDEGGGQLELQLTEHGSGE